MVSPKHKLLKPQAQAPTHLTAIRPPVCESRRAVCFGVLEVQFPDLIVSPTASFPPPKIPFGNRALTMVSVWLGRKDALIALVLTCWQRMQASALDGPPM